MRGQGDESAGALDGEADLEDRKAESEVDGQARSNSVLRKETPWYRLQGHRCRSDRPVDPWGFQVLVRDDGR
jgi:hypothetical protein